MFRARMTIWLSTILVCAIHSQPSYPVRETRLPNHAAEALSERFGEWQYADIYIPIYSSQGRVIGQKYADLIQGDFDGDGRIDYAGIFDLRDSSISPLPLIVMLSRDSTYDFHILDYGARDIPTIVGLVEKGKVQKDMESDLSYKHSYDSIGWYYYEKAGGTYFYRGGKFHHITTSD